jgi:vancomycin resistance protein YoaR
MNRYTRIRRGAQLVTILAAFALTIFSVGCTHNPTSPSVTANSAGTMSVVTIPQGVTIDGIAVGGETLAAAKVKLAAAIVSKENSVSIRLRDSASGSYYHYNVRDFGAYFDTASALASAVNAAPGTSLSCPLKVDSRLVALHLSRIADNWNSPVEEPHVTFLPHGQRTVSKGHAGRSVNEALALTAVMANLPSLTKPLATTEVPFVTTPPQVQPHSVMAVDDVLTSYTTTFNPGNATRTNNLLLAVKNINGTVVGPGEVFSYNDSVGPRTQQTGFQDAIIYVDNRMKKDVGGGICQASSTLYNCVLLANMPIVERHAHSLPVHYVPPGRDATVAWGGDDFRFRNNTTKPIIVRATATSGGTLTEYLIGDKTAVPHPNEKVAIVVTPKETLPDGFKVFSYRVVKEDGILIAKEPLGVSCYHNLVGGVPH